MGTSKRLTDTQRGPHLLGAGLPSPPKTTPERPVQCGDGPAPLQAAKEVAARRQQGWNRVIEFTSLAGKRRKGRFSCPSNKNRKDVHTS